MCTILKKFLERTHIYEDAPFLGPKWSICSKQEFFWKKLLILLSSTSWSFSWRTILQKLLQNFPRKAINKSSKTLFFVPFLVIFACWGFFPKIPALPHTTIMGPEKFQKKGRNGRPYFIGALWKHLEVQKMLVYSLKDFLTIILSYYCVAILLAKMVLWAPFSQLMCTFSFCIKPCTP